ncbi:MAG TPA: type II toxin-antitoxin system Phd/YefM family antitoxin [Rhodothermales bacterium]|nr:type II toxin-antitoxin system Phd/YefM family antitoxin [Rhodothermales bacterium]
MSTTTTGELRKNLAEIINQAAYGHERTVITRAGKPLAAIVSIEDLEAMEALEDLTDIRAAEAAKREDAEHGGPTPLKDFLRELEQEEGDAAA